MKRTDRYPEKLSGQEMRIALSIKNAPVPAVPQEEIEAACRTAVSYYTERQSIRDAGFWKVVLSCAAAGSAFFWLLSAFLLGSVVVISLLNAGDEALPFSLMMTVAPVPVLAYVIRELQYRDEALTLLEKTCKYAPARICYARLWVGMFFNALFVLLTGLTAFARYEQLLKLYFCAFTVMFFIGSAALFCMAFSDSALPLSLMMAAWVLGASYLLHRDEIFEFVMDTGTGVLAAGLLLSFGLFAAAAAKATAALYA